MIKIYVFIVVVILAYTVAARAEEQSASVKSNPYCMSQVCLGDKLSNIKIDWQDIPAGSLLSKKEKNKINISSKAYKEIIAGITEEDFSEFIYSFLDKESAIGLVTTNQEFFANLKRICGTDIRLSGNFTSDSGYETKVLFSPVLPENKGPAYFAVVRLQRVIPASTKAERLKILKMASKRYGGELRENLEIVFIGDSAPLMKVEGKEVKVMAQAERRYGRQPGGVEIYFNLLTHDVFRNEIGTGEECVIQSSLSLD